MSKFIKCWVFIICLLFIFLILFTDRVNALEIGQVYNSSIGNLVSKTETLNIGSNTFTYSIDDISIGDYNQIRGDLYYSILKTNDTYTGNINLTETCTHYTDNETRYRIVYADGTSAQIESTMWHNFCDTHSQSGTQSFTYNYEPQIVSTNIEVSIKESYGNVYYQCRTTDMGYFECDIPKNKTLNGIRFRFSLSKYGPTSIRFGLFVNHLFKVKTEVQEIISNNNTNTQNIINNQNQNSDREYNFISNSTIDTSTTSNINNIDVSNSDTKLAVTNFALIPLNFMQSIINSFNSTCSQVCIGNCGSGHDNDWRFVFPCLDFESILGSNLYNIIDSLFAFGMVFAFIRSVRKFFFNALLLTTDASSEVGVFL